MTVTLAKGLLQKSLRKLDSLPLHTRRKHRWSATNAPDGSGMFVSSVIQMDPGDDGTGYMLELPLYAQSAPANLPMTGGPPPFGEYGTSVFKFDFVLHKKEEEFRMEDTITILDL